MPRRETKGDDGFRGVEGLREEVGGEGVGAEGVEHEYEKSGRWECLMMIGI